MTKSDLPIPIHKMAFLQAYLYEIFGAGNKCTNSFKHTKWYLKENYSDKEIEALLEFFKEKGVSCDCDILKKLDLQNYSNDNLNFHN
jgi:hypothetical protein